MLLTRLHARGLPIDVDLDDLTANAGLGPSPVAAADALVLWAAALSPTPDLRALGCALPTTALADEVVAPLDPDAVGAAIAADEVTVEVTLQPDPPLFGRLRELAARDTRLVAALGHDASLHVKVGWRLPRDRRAAAPDLLGLRIGDVGFPIAGADRPAWQQPLLADLAARVHRVDLGEPWVDVVRRIEAAALAPTPGPRAAWARARRALRDLGWPEPELIRGPRLAFGDTLIDARLLGRPATDAVRCVEAALLRAPDILVVPDPVAAPLRAWLAARTDGDDATLEQVLG